MVWAYLQTVSISVLGGSSRTTHKDLGVEPRPVMNEDKDEDDILKTSKARLIESCLEVLQ
jgi:hypothetical protein